MKKGKILIAVGSVIAIIGVYFLAFAILPAEETMDFTIPAGDYYYAISYGGLIGGSVELNFVVADGAIKAYVFDEDQYGEYSTTGSGDYLFTTSGDSGSFSFVIPDLSTYYVVFDHGTLSSVLSQDVIVETTINGVALVGTVIGVAMIVFGAVLAIVGMRMKNREIPTVAPSNVQTDVTIFQGQQQEPPGQV
ncbi:MAG: hypothetical protein KKE24_05530 [Candidatus Thermoplasmatota archaeon]|nr:hypothetical protein [Candidatus Thermoplasmatota archaeon]